MGWRDRLDRIDELIERVGENEERYKVFLDASPWGILVVDQTFHIVFTNKPFERISGYRTDELIGKHLHFILPEEDRSAHTQREKEYIKNPRQRIGNHGLRPRVQTKYGYAVDVEISLSPTRLYGQQLFYATVRQLGPDDIRI